MKLQPDRLEGVNVIAGHDARGLIVNAQRWTESIVVPAQGEVRAWDCAQFEALTAEHFERLLADAPEIVLIGTGTRQRFVPPALLRGLIERRIGVECMDTVAACRTYNVLVGERRRVTAALLPG
ncbi:MAG TPA: Mth938-like domain-containing protein [Burkholderiaceae bacterium]|nr:Mth938-like domain-containing protein [Burkholderiaceae bacterium]